MVEIDTRALEHAATAFADALARADLAMLARLYAPDAVLLPPAADLLRGREAIVAYWRVGLATGTVTVDLVPLARERRDGLSCEIGRYALTLVPACGDRAVDQGRYVLVHRREEDGAWLRVVEMFTPDLSSRTG